MCAMALSCCFPRSRRDKATNAMKFCEIDVATFRRASGGEKPVFESRTSLESDDSDVAKSAIHTSTVVEIGDISYLCEETPFVRKTIRAVEAFELQLEYRPDCSTLGGFPSPPPFNRWRPSSRLTVPSSGNRCARSSTRTCKMTTSYTPHSWLLLCS